MVIFFGTIKFKSQIWHTLRPKSLEYCLITLEFFIEISYPSSIGLDLTSQIVIQAIASRFGSLTLDLSYGHSSNYKSLFWECELNLL